ncbi:MAG: glycoside hydrolase family 25 protein [Oscillospiraceae bacterium]|jgi:lysozyme|nr:glycoside hydrolase family 25 protein [Oscillospiraceae bacterium]MDD3261201.1 glycoside hydrolase family 25 protein [Oscillospiraceae bacterium]
MRQTNRAFRTKKHKKSILIITVAAILAAAVLLTVLFRSCGTNSSIKDGQQYASAEETIITDRYEGTKIIPKYDFAKNTLSDSKFSTANGIKSYTGAVNGVDVSSWQGDVDWKKVKAAGIYFAMIRVGYRGQTVGTIKADTKFAQNMKGALAAGLKVGVYFYSQAVSETEAKEEADYVIRQISSYKVTWPVVFDWELGDDEANSVDSTLRTSSATPDEVTKYTATFCSCVKAAGYQPCYYTNKAMGYTTFNLKTLSAYPIWYAEYQDLPSFYYHFDIWQYTAKGKVNGIDGTADLNISFQKFT